MPVATASTSAGRIAGSRCTATFKPEPSRITTAWHLRVSPRTEIEDYVDRRPAPRIRPLVRRGAGGPGQRAERDEPRDGDGGRHAVGTHRPVEGFRRAGIRLLHR